MLISRKYLYLSAIVCLALVQLNDATEMSDISHTNNDHHLHTRQVNPENLINVPSNPEWMKTIDFTHVQGQVRPVSSGKCSAPKCDGSDNNDCYQDCGCLPHKSDVFGCTIPNTWSLTFDDGPSEVTPVLLDILKNKGVKATFCIIGAYAEQYPDILKRIYDEGHQIASHTYSHAHLMSLTNEEIVNELRATDEVVRRITGVTPRYVRPPFGEADDRVKALLQEMGYKVLMWNVDPHDYNLHMKPDGGMLIQNGFQDVLDGKRNDYNVFKDPGYISLQHDLYGPSVQQVDQIIDLVRSRGYDIMPVNMCTGESVMHYVSTKEEVNVKSSSTIPKDGKKKYQEESNNAQQDDEDEIVQAASKTESKVEPNVVVAEMNVEKASEEGSKVSGASKLVVAATSLISISLGFIQFLF